MKVARNEKRKKLLGFSFYINIGNFEAFLWNLTLSAKLLFWRCVLGSFVERPNTTQLLQLIDSRVRTRVFIRLNQQQKSPLYEQKNSIHR